MKKSSSFRYATIKKITESAQLCHTVQSHSNQDSVCVRVCSCEIACVCVYMCLCTCVCQWVCVSVCLSVCKCKDFTTVLEKRHGN